MTNRKGKVSEIAKELQVLAGSIENRVHERLHMSKVSSHWVRQNLSLYNRHQHVALRQELLDSCERLRKVLLSFGNWG